MRSSQIFSDSMFVKAATTILFISCTIVVRADSWPGAIVQNIFSRNGQHFVRIIPGRSMGDVVGFAGSPKGPFARGEFYARNADRSYRLVADVPLVNPVSPVDGIVSDRGFLLTLDNWHNFGYGKVVAMYNPDGKLVRTLTLEELYPAKKIEEIPMSVSSRWWRCSPHGFADPDRQSEIYVSEHFGGIFVFGVETGGFRYDPGKAKCDPPKGPFSASWFSRVPDLN